jgi:hypothetical protein
MSQEIFRRGLAVETVSAYLLCCALKDEGRPIHRETLLSVWNAAEEALDAALSELLADRILVPQQPDGGYALQPTAAWRRR